MNHTQVHAVVEIVNRGGKAFDFSKNGVDVAKVIAASHAFRKYDWLQNAPIKNASGNLRGIVVNARAKVVYDFTFKYGSKVERFNTFVTVGIALANSSEEIYKIVASREPGYIKSAKLGTQATAIAMSILTGIVTVPAHAVLTAMQGYCEIADILKGQQVGTCGQTLRAIDVSVESAASQVSDGNNIYTFINTTINPAISRAFGF